ncbi:MAG: 2-amino-4-hydroxy-6-hydroxymethyldihydropteridine diphosphokinase [bacterium]|nr:2-amino-4-hydroxy-6-hydroxymethyldihydropteridine diphosphokinase [bacterium]
MVLFYLALGSNLGDRIQTIDQAIARLARGGDIRPLRLSSLFETEPEGLVDRAKRFINCVLEAETALSPLSLLDSIGDVENAMGRVRPGGGAVVSRTLDLDILFYGDVIVDCERLQIPHPRMYQRRFVLAPLAELCPHRLAPPTRHTVRELLLKLDGGEKCQRVREGREWNPQEA